MNREQLRKEAEELALGELGLAYHIIDLAERWAAAQGVIIKPNSSFALKDGKETIWKFENLSKVELIVNVRELVK